MSIIEQIAPPDAEWLNQVVVNVAKGRRGTHATVDKQGRSKVAAWLNWQGGKVREGSMSAAEYANAPKAQRDADKAAAGGAWYSFSTYTDQHRDGNNWQGSNVVVLDADAKHGKEEGAQYSFTADDLRNRLDGLQFAALPTYSYTDACPRWRIVIPLNETLTARNEFAAVARHLAGLLDEYVDPRSYTPEQYWFSMSAPKGEWENRLGLIVVGV